MSDENQTIDTPSVVEAEAAELGWVPEAEWRGKPESWVSAEAFLEKSRTMVPLLRKQAKEQDAKIRRLMDSVGQLTSKLEAAQQDLASFEEFHTEEVTRRVEQTRAELKRQLTAAKRDGDHETEVELTDQLTQLNAAAKPPEKKAEAKPDQPQVNPQAAAAFNAFIGRHPELVDTSPQYDADLADEFEIIARRVARTRPELRFEAFFAEVERQAGARRPARGKVDSGVGSSRSAAAGNAHSYDDLDKEAKAACEANVKRFVRKDGKWPTPEAYRAHYIKQLEDTGYFQ
jgi:hypothetical protein